MDLRITRPSAHTAAAVEPLEAPFPVPEYPPAAWFDKPEWLEPGQRLTVTDEGQIAGYFYERGVCLIDGTDDCWQPPPSPSGYAAFHQQELVTAEGDTVRVGVIGNVGGHASPFASIVGAQRHYSDPNAQVIACVAGDDETGGWIAGALVPGVTYADVALVRRSALSGDWRWFDKPLAHRASPGYDCVGPTLVTRPGLPLVRAYARAASAHPVFLGGDGGVQIDPGGSMKITLPDGTVLDVDPEDVRAAARTAAPEDAAPPETEAEESSEDDRVAALEERVAAIEDVLQQMMAASDAEMQAALAAELASIDDGPRLPRP